MPDDVWGRTRPAPRRFRYPQELRTAGAVVAFVGFWEAILGVYLLFRCNGRLNGACIGPSPEPGLALVVVGAVILASGGVAYLVVRLPARS